MGVRVEGGEMQDEGKSEGGWTKEERCWTRERAKEAGRRQEMKKVRMDGRGKQ